VTAGLAPGFVQANLAVLPRDAAYDFLLFCQRNPRPCPLIEVTDAGSPEPVGVAPGADLRTDLPRYRIYKDGVMADEVTDITPFWRDDLVSFLLGCSFTFEWALLDAGHSPPPHRAGQERGDVEDLGGVPAGRALPRPHGGLDAPHSPEHDLQGGDRLRALSRRSRRAGAGGRSRRHRHQGRDPSGLGRLRGNPGGRGAGLLGLRRDTQAVALASKPEFMITHSPGSMFITDLPNHQLAAI
jgi:hypothetical protein